MGGGGQQLCAVLEECGSAVDRSPRTPFGEGRGRRELQDAGKGLTRRQGGVDLEVWIVLFFKKKKKAGLKNVETRAFLTVGEVLQLLTNRSW